MKKLTLLFSIICAVVLMSFGSTANAAPTIQATYVGFGQIATTSFQVDCIFGNGDKRIVVASSNSGTDWVAVDAAIGAMTTEFADNGGVWTGAPQVGATGAYVVDVFNLNERWNIFTGLTANTVYKFKVYEYTLTGAVASYNVANASGNPKSRRTLKVAPVLAAKGNVGYTTPPGANTAVLNWTDANVPANLAYIVDIATDRAFATKLVDYNSLDVGSTLTYTATTSLAANSMYYYRVRGFNNYTFDGINCKDTTANSNIDSLYTAPLPTAVSASGPLTFCVPNTINLTYTPVAGLTYQWYKDNAIITGATSSPLTVNASGTYKVLATNVNLKSTYSSDVVVVVNPQPVAPTAAGTQICSNNTATVTATLPAGATFKWYSASTGGTLLGSLPSYTTPVLTNSGSTATTSTYYVESISAAGCPSATRTAVVVTVNPLPVAPTAATPTAICAGGSTTITATAPANSTYKWYTVATGGTSFFTGATLSTGVLNATTDYWVEATDNTTLCVGPTRTKVTVTVNALPAAPTAPGVAVCIGTNPTLTANTQAGVTFAWYAAPTGGTPLATGLTYTPTGLTTTTTFYLEAISTTTPTLCPSATRTAVVATINPLPAATSGTTGATICSGNTANIKATLPADCKFNWYSTSTGGTILGTTAVGANFTTPVLTSTTTYYVESVNLATNCPAATRTAVTVNVNPLPSAPLTNGATVCSNNTAILSVNTPDAGMNYAWYTASTGGTSIGVGTSFTTPVLNTTTTYYVEPTSISTGCVGPRTAAIATINPLPSAPTVPALSVCSGSTALVSVNPTTAGIVYNWFTAAAGGTPLNVAGPSATFTTPALVAPATYYVEAINNSTGCISATRTPVTVGVYTLPNLSVTAQPAAVCEPALVNLTLATIIDANGTTGTTKYYSNAAATTEVTTPTAVAAGTYYARKTTTVGGCASNIVTLTATVNPTPALVASTQPTAVCAPGTVNLTTATLTDSKNVPGTINYYTDATAQTLVGSATAVTAGTYYARKTATIGGCLSPIVTLTATVNPLPTVAITNVAGAKLCTGGTQTLTLTTSNTLATSYVWKKDGTPIALATSATYAVTLPGSYTVTATSANACVSVESAPYVIGAIADVTGISISADQFKGATENATFTVTATGATGYQWQVSTNGGTSYTDIATATTATLNLTSVTQLMTGNKYHCVLSNGCGTFTSAAATLTVVAPFPTTQASGLTWLGRSRTSLYFGWTKGNGSKRFVTITPGIYPTVTPAVPTPAVAYTANSTIGVGSLIGAATRVVYQDSILNTTYVYGLTKNTNYIIHVMEANGTGTMNNYNTTMTATNIATRMTSYKDDENYEMLTSNGNTFMASAISPNPVADVAMVVVNSEINSGVKFEIFNSIGDKVYFSDMNASIGENRFELNVHGMNRLAAGSYTLRVTMGEDHIDQPLVVMP